MPNIVIALDGPSGSGKSSLAKMLARHYNFQQVDSGAIYRTYTYWALQFCSAHNISLSSAVNHAELLAHLKSLDLRIEFRNNRQFIFVQAQDMEELIRSPLVTDNIRYIADSREIRDLVNAGMRKMSQEYNLVADGRDIATVVFPHADVKLFIEADLQERAKRRYAEMKEKDISTDLYQLVEKMSARDEQDKNREFGALLRAPDAIFIDTTNQSLELAFQSIQQVVDSKLAASKSYNV